MATTPKNLGASGVLYTDRRRFYIKPEQFAELWPAVTPFTTFVMGATQSLTGLTDPLFKLFEHRNPWQKQEFQNNGSTNTISAAGSSTNPTAATITMDTPVGLPSNSTANSAYVGLECEVWDSTKTTKKGVVLITAVGDNTVSVKNLGSSDIVCADNDYFVVIGNARGEGTTSPQAWADDLSVVYGQTQIFRTPVEITGTLYQASLRGANNELARLRAQKAAEHKMQMERAFMFGSNRIGLGLADSRDGAFNESFGDSPVLDANGNVVRTAMGIVTAIEKYGSSTATDEHQNIFDFASGMSWSQFVDATEKIFQYLPTSGVKRAFAGPSAMSWFSKLESNNSRLKSGFDIRITNMQTSSLGYNFRYLETPFGVVELIYTPALKRERTNYLVIPTEENIFHATYRPSAYKTNIKTDDGYDGIKDEYFSDEGIGMTLIESHSIMKLPKA